MGGRGSSAANLKASQRVSPGSSALAQPLAPGCTSCSGCIQMSARTDEGWNANKAVSFDLNGSVAIISWFLMELHNSWNITPERIHMKKKRNHGFHSS